MKISCDREKLASAFFLAGSIAQARSPKEILQYVKIEATTDHTTLMATDMETGIRIEVEGVDVVAPGKALLHADRVGKILKESQDDRLSLEVVDGQIRIQGIHSEFKLNAVNPDEYPTIAGFEEQRYHEIPTRLFREMVRRTIFATDPDSTRFALGGVLLEMSGDNVLAVGTDGRRLARMVGTGTAVGGHETVGSTTIIPTRSLSLMERSIGEQSDVVQLACRGSDVQMRTAGCTIYSRLVEGRYPNWRQVIPERQESVRMSLTVGPFHNVIRQAAIVADQESRGLNFEFGGGTLLLTAQTADLGQSRVEMPIEYEGEKIQLKLDHRFVSDFLRVLDPDTRFTLDIVNSTASALLTTDDGYAYVVMPMALDK